MLYKVANAMTGSGAEASKADEGASLTMILETPTLRVELALLVLLCADAMRSELLATFDPDKTHEPSSTSSKPPPKAAAVHDLISFDTPQDEESITAERARRARQQEIETTQMQALRRSALTFFDKWRAGVLNRVCEVLCLRGEVVRQAKAKRKQVMEESERAKQGNSLLIDFGGDPFGDIPTTNNSAKKHGPYEAIDNKLLAFGEEKRTLILHCLLLLVLSLEHYTAHSRVLLIHLATSLGIGMDVLAEQEKSVAQGLLQTVASRMDAEDATKKQAANDSASRKWKIGLAAVGGAVLVGVTGGLAAPLLAAGVGTVMGGLGLGAVSGLLGTLAGSSVLVGSLFGAYGGKMTGRLMRQYAREVQDFEFIPVRDSDRHPTQDFHEWSEEQHVRDPTKTERHRLRVAIGVSGWLNSPSDVNKPWEVIDTTGAEPFSLRFELEAMLRMGNSLNDVLFSYAWDGVTYTVVSRTLLGALYAGLWPLGLVKAASVLDNPFSVAIARADKAGKVMARALIDKVQGERPVTLMGYSIGARVIYSCLVELAEQHAFGLVESVILMGAPVPSDTRSWRQIRSVVTGRVVNVYSTEDYILGFLYRSTKLQMGVAGLQEVKDVHGIENVDMSKVVSGHDKYRYLAGTILTKVGFLDVDYNRVAEQERAMEVAERKKQQVREKVRMHKKDIQQRDPSTQNASEMIIVPEMKPKADTLVDLSGTAPSRTPTFPVQRPIIMQQRSGQQPMRTRTMPPPTAQQEHSHQRTLKPFADLDMSSIYDSLPTSPVQFTPASTAPSSPPQSQRSVHSFAPRGISRQTPTNMVPTPRAPPQQTNFTTTATAAVVRAADTSDSEDEKAYRIHMVDADSQKFSPSLQEMLRIPVSGSTTPVAPASAEKTTSIAPVVLGKPTVAVNEPDKPKLVPSVVIQEIAVDEDEDDGYSTTIETDSECGELSMVEPVPLDDGDLGLLT